MSADYGGSVTPQGQQIVFPDQMEDALRIHKSKPHPKLGAALLQENIINVKQLNVALQKQVQGHKVPLGQILVEMGVVTDEVITRVLSQTHGIPDVNYRAFQVDPSVIEAIPAALAIKHRLIPLYVSESRLVVAMEDPFEREAVQDLELCVQLNIDPVLASWDDIEFMLQKFYGLPANFPEQVMDTTLERETDFLPAAKDFAEAVRDETNRIIFDAIEQGASEIHIETMPGDKPGRVRFRKEGVMHPYTEFAENFCVAMVSHVKAIGGLDVLEKRRAQEGWISYEHSGFAHNLYIVTVPTFGGLEDVVMRVPSALEMIPLDSLALSPPVLAELKTLLSKPRGLLCVCGPTGSGRTTTLHSLIGYLNTSERKIWTVEEPIKIIQEGLRQIEVNSKSDWTFSAALRSLSSAGPDVIMVGSANEPDTARAVVEASLANRLVLTGMRTNGAAESLARLVNFGIDPFDCADALCGALAQRLVRRLCTACRKPYAASGEELDMLARHYRGSSGVDAGDVVSRWRAQSGSQEGSLSLFSKTGCEQCNFTGYRGWIAVFELLIASETIKSKIHARAGAQELFRIAVSEGMQTMKQDGIEKVLLGYTDFEQVQAVCP